MATDNTDAIENLKAQIAAKGEEIRVMKTSTPPASKDELAPLVNALLALKVEYKNLTGEEFGGPKPEKAKKEAVVQEKKNDGPSKAELNKLKRKENKAAKKAAEKAEKGETEGAEVESSSKKTNNNEEEDTEFAAFYGDAPLVQSQVTTNRVFVNIGDIPNYAGQTVWVRARVSTSRSLAKGCFILLRQTVNTVQAVVWQGAQVPKAMVKYANSISLESIIDVRAEVIQAATPVQSATVKLFELSVKEIHVISRAQELPFLVEDAGKKCKYHFYCENVAEMS